MIAEIDQRDYRAALAQAEAQVAGAEAGIHNIDAQIATQDAQIAANQAQVAQAQANLELTQVTWGRDKPLVNQGWATAQQGTIDVQNLKAQQAAVDSAQAALKVAQRQIDTLKAQRALGGGEPRASAGPTRPGRAQPLLYDRHRRPAGPRRQPHRRRGAISRRRARTSPCSCPTKSGSTANFKETQLDRMRPGQPVDIEIDAYPERAFHGHVDSVQPGSGTGVLAAAAGERHRQLRQDRPARAGQDHPGQSAADVALGPGMSVVPTVRVDPTPSLYERLKARVEQWWRRV